MDSRRVYDPISDPPRICAQCIPVQMCTIHRKEAMDYEFPKPSTLTVKNTLDICNYMITTIMSLRNCFRNKSYNYPLYHLSSCLDALCIVQLGATIYNLMGYE